MIIVIIILIIITVYTYIYNDWLYIMYTHTNTGLSHFYIG